MGLGRLREVAQRLGLHRPAPLSVVISGTNGKGSHVASIDHLLRQLGFRVGTYTSPHLLRYNERVCLNGEPVDDERLIQAFEAIEKIRGDVSLSFFEFGTLAALQIFQHSALDIVILEVGLGGRLDAVNLVDADIAVITSIGLDHQDWLGDSRETIAVEKAGIFRPGIPVVCTENNPPDSLLHKASELGCQLYLRGREFDLEVSDPGHAWHWQGTDAEGVALTLQQLPWPSVAPVNVAGALQVVTLLLSGPAMAEADISPQATQHSANQVPVWKQRLIAIAEDVLRCLTLPGRQQWVRSPQGLPVVLDVSHNTEAGQSLAATIHRWRLDHPHGRVHQILAMMQDKDHAGYYHVLEKEVDFWYIAHFDLPRCMPAERLHAVLLRECASPTGLTLHTGVLEAFFEACQRAGEGDLIVVSGSFITVSEVMQHTVADTPANRPDQEASSP